MQYDGIKKEADFNPYFKSEKEKGEIKILWTYHTARDKNTICFLNNFVILWWKWSDIIFYMSNFKNLCCQCIACIYGHLTS